MTKGKIPFIERRRARRLGGVEYRTLGALMWILPAYLLFWITLGTAFLVPYSYCDSVASIIQSSQPGNLKPGWYAFISVTALIRAEYASQGGHFSPS